MKNYLICSNSRNEMKRLNESEATNEKYILKGCFANLDTLNRNGRIYTKEEYLRHLQYLRDDIRKGEPLLGELDHPDDRFEVKLKEASHRIIDLWFDEGTDTIMGKIELLDTPNGKLAKSLVDDGVPLHISSRAAGTVNPDKTVSIQQIYTYDLVAKPGFANAVLYRVNESEATKSYSDSTLHELQKFNTSESKNEAQTLGFINEDVTVMDMTATASIRKEAKEINSKNIDVKELAKHLIKESDEDEVKTDAPETEDNNTESDDTEKKGVEILDVKVESDVEILDVKPEDEEGDKEDEEGDKPKDGESEDESNEDTNEDETVECDGTCNDKKDNTDKEEPKVTDANRLNDEASKSIKTHREKLDEIDEIIANLKKKKNEGKSANESVILSQYPLSAKLNEENFAQFSSLNETQKRNVVEYLAENKLTDKNAINENWNKGVNYSTDEPTWLRLAPESYRKLYDNAPESVKESIKNTAEYILFENQHDIVDFWENTGLENSERTRLLNESFINNMPKVSTESKETGLEYSKDFINMIAEMGSQYC